MKLPLNGVRILDLSRMLAGDYAAMILGDLGAVLITKDTFPEGEG